MNYVYEVRKNYRQDDVLRKSFNELAGETFGLDFEGWYQNGYWTDNYNPYSIVIDNKVVSNISVNKMEFMCDGEHKTYIQLGTVMTDKEYRNQGLTKILMKEIENDFIHMVDGFYLFANDSVLDYYPKFGYEKATEYQYSKVIIAGSKEMSCKPARQIEMNNKEARLLLEKAIDTSISNSSFAMIHNKGLIMFYVTQFMKSNVYYIEGDKAYVVAEIKEDRLLLHMIFSEKVVNIDNIASAFGSKINKVVLGFTPLCKEGYEIEEVCEENTTLFVKGRVFTSFNEEKRMFPLLSHA